MKEDEFKRKLDAMGAQIKAGENPFIGLHVVFGQMVEAGFTDAQACTIIGTWIGYQAGGQK